MSKRKKSVKNEQTGSEIDYSKTQNFLISAISDISGYIKFLDTKVSIIMAALGVIISGTINCRETVFNTYNKIQKYSFLNIFMCIVMLLFSLCVILVFFWGLCTIKAHYCSIDYKSAWFIKDKKEDYSFEAYKHEVENMTSKDVIDTLSAELYKLNDIYKQKAKTTKCAIREFATALVLLVVLIAICLFVNFI